MYILLILFFVSLLGIIFMIGRKFLMLQNGQAQILSEEENFLQTPYLEDLKLVTVKKLKVVGHKSLVETIRFYLRSMNLLRNNYEGVKTKIQTMRKKNINDDSPDKQKISKFLKIISDYKHKIRQLKRKIKEEENL